LIVVPGQLYGRADGGSVKEQDPVRSFWKIGSDKLRFHTFNFLGMSDYCPETITMANEL
jgi:hypothetical protein